MRHHRKQLKPEEGSVLIIGLIVLAMLTALALSSLRGATVQEKMTANSDSRNIAVQMAESALRDAEEKLKLSPDSISIGKASTGNVSGIACLINKVSGYDFASEDTWTASSQSPCVFSGGAKNSVKAPLYFVEFFYASPIVDMSDPLRLRTCFYRISARGYGVKESGSVTLQSTYRFTNCS